MYKDITGCKVDENVANNYCDICGITENLRWFGNTNKIICAKILCYEKQNELYLDECEYLDHEFRFRESMEE